jgi:D-alanine-D-alanine ligase
MKNLDIISAKFKKVAVLYGGDSSERDVSLVSGNRIYQSLTKQNIPSILIDTKDSNLINTLKDKSISHAFIAVHGKGGEDGQLQALLEFLQIPYTGSNVKSLAISIDKYKSKLIWRSIGVTTPKGTLITQVDDLSAYQHYIPAFVKPCEEGSSIGVNKVNNLDELHTAYKQARQYNQDILIEEFILGRELTVGILNNTVLPTLQIKSKAEFYDYEAKYNTDSTEYIVDNSLTALQQQKLNRLALLAFNSLGCSGWGRVDVIEDANGEFWVLEVNTVPGMSEKSLMPMAANVLGMNFDQLVLTILATAKN